MFSTTYIAEYVKLFTVIALFFGFTVDEQALLELVGLLVVICTSIWTLYQRYKRGDVHIFGTRK